MLDNSEFTYASVRGRARLRSAYLHEREGKNVIVLRARARARTLYDRWSLVVVL